MGLQPYVKQLRLERNLTNKLQFTEAYNIPIQKDSDIDDFDTKLDKSQLKSLLKHLLLYEWECLQNPTHHFLVLQLLYYILWK